MAPSAANATSQRHSRRRVPSDPTDPRSSRAVTSRTPATMSARCRSPAWALAVGRHVAEEAVDRGQPAVLERHDHPPVVDDQADDAHRPRHRDPLREQVRRHRTCAHPRVREHRHALEDAPNPVRITTVFGKRGRCPVERTVPLPSSLRPRSRLVHAPSPPPRSPASRSSGPPSPPPCCSGTPIWAAWCTSRRPACTTWPSTRCCRWCSPCSRWRTAGASGPRGSGCRSCGSSPRSTSVGDGRSPPSSPDT